MLATAAQTGPAGPGTITTLPGGPDDHLLRVAIGLHETWWTAAVVAAVCVGLIVLLVRTHNRPGDRVRTQRLVVALGALAAVFVWAAITLATTAFWTPADDPERFNQLIAGPNYALLDDWRAAHAGETPTIAALAGFAAERGPIELTARVQWPYMRDALGQPLMLQSGTLLVTSDGRQLPR